MGQHFGDGVDVCSMEHWSTRLIIRIGFLVGLICELLETYGLALNAIVISSIVLLISL